MPLPVPDEAALRHSRALEDRIVAEIADAGGWISFSRYMERALYAPGLGYYSGGAAKFGGAGDFVTAPEISPLFGWALARQAAQILESLPNGGDLLEFGAGTGRLACDLLSGLEELDALPGRYCILELSGELRQRQRQSLERLAPALASRVEWLDRLPDAFEGLMLANEVLDAMPVHRVVWRNAGLFERGVAAGTPGSGAFAWSDRLLQDGALFEAARQLIPFVGPGGPDEASDHVSEIGLAARGFVASAARVLRRGVLLLIDYGFGRSEYYHPQRTQGTLMCHYRHHAHDDPFHLPGLQDITAHVDFSAVTDAAAGTGLDLLGYTTQAHFLVGCGIAARLARTPVERAAEYLPLANQLQTLVSPAEMGELFKAIAFGRDVSGPLIGFAGFGGSDRSRQL